MKHDIVIPMLSPTWCTRAVLEGLFHHYAPRHVHIITPREACARLNEMMQTQSWAVGDVLVHPEEPFFEGIGLTKADLCAAVDLKHSLYSPGWFYQQLLKLGASVGIDGLSEDYLVWDADLLPLDTWPVIDEAGQFYFALLQHKSRGNPDIVGRWERWIKDVLDVAPIEDGEATFVQHHMWFSQARLQAMFDRIGAYYASSEPWPALMMRSANDFGTFSEYWLYASWVAATTQDGPRCYPYADYGESTERFFDDGTGPFSSAMRIALKIDHEVTPSYAQVESFVCDAYADGRVPSSIAFEQNPRHIKKDRANMHLEEVRSRWHASTLSESVDTPHR